MMKRCSLIALFFALIIILGLGVGFLRFSSLISNPYTISQEKTDAIIALTGGSERIKTAIDLLKEEKSYRLFISGVYPNVTLEEILKQAGIEENDFADRIFLGYNATNTKGNASETEEWIKENNIKSIRLVTSAYHMPRSLLEFEALLPEIKLVPHPVYSESVKHEKWWKWKGTFMLIASEYFKFIAVYCQKNLFFRA